MVPGKNDTGTNTEISTSDVATTALDDFAHGDRGRGVRIGVVLVDMPLRIFDDDDGVIDHQSGGQRDAEQASAS